jgi:lactate dehydrogenase-like 2-hydroxyacid dehydrogenase
VVIVGRYGFNADAFHSAPKLKMISLWQTGYDNVDLAAADEHGVIVSNVPNYAFDSVAEFTFALALNLMRKVHSADMNLRKGNFDWRCLIGNELMSKTLGVLGTGDIGKRVIQIAHGFNMSVLSTTAHPSPEKAKTLGVKFVGLDTLLHESDIVTLHFPLTPETEHMIGASELAKMKPTSILINTARGKIIDETALVEALRARRLQGRDLMSSRKSHCP